MDNLETKAKLRRAFDEKLSSSPKKEEAGSFS
jgi:hypothetical protein